MKLTNILRQAVVEGASDVFIIAGLPLSHKISDRIVRVDADMLKPAETESLIENIYSLAQDRSMEHLYSHGDDDFSFSLSQISRFRVSVYKQRGSLAAVIRIVTFELPNPADIGIPQAVMDMSLFRKGLVLVTGSAGSGKSTTLACIIDKINAERNSHVITLEDPLEFLHRHNKSIISQREISVDTESYVVALRAALRQSPDVILLGEMRDYETINVAMTAAETGHLIFSTLHTVGVSNTIDRIIDVFPVNQQAQIRVQLSMVLQAVVSQQLIPTVDGKLAPAFEVMICNGAIRNMIRESKAHQIDAVLASSGDKGSVTMNASLQQLYQKGRITKENALIFSPTPELLQKKL